MVLQFETLPGDEQRKAMKQQGIELLDYIPSNSFTASVSRKFEAEWISAFKIRAVINPGLAQKMEPALFEGQTPSWAVNVPGAVDVWISFPKSFDYNEVLQQLLLMNIQVISSELKDYRVLALRIPSLRVSEIAAVPFIEYMQFAPAPDAPLNSNSMFASRAHLLRAPLLSGGMNLNGSGVVVGVGDNGDIQSHLDFTGRLINRSGEIIRAHASHVAGTIAGAGIIRELYTGYAPKATIVSQVFSKIFTKASTYVQDHGMVITNNSFGTVTNDCHYNGLYDLSSRILDQQAFDFPELQHVFAAGNDGIRTCTPYPAAFKTVLGGYQSAKNVLTVGSTDFKSDISNFSSRGPVRDGRVKPEVTSMGQFVASTWVDNVYSYNNGTSMAAPGVTGGLALLVQKYRAMHGGNNPKSGLMKALIINGGEDRGNPGPDFSYGFGRINLLRSYSMLNGSTYFTGTLANGNTITRTITVPANTARLKVLLYWQDPPASVMAAKTLVNDLDLQVVTPGSTTLLPSKLDTVSANVANNATTGVDRINNVEQVVIDNPAAGNYDLKAIATAIAQNPTQEYYLVYDIIPLGIVLTNPVGGEGLWPTVSTLDTFYIQWDDHGGPASQFTLEFTSDGTNWSTLDAAIPATKRIFSWPVPDNPTDAARIRLTKNGTGISQTSFPFTITAMAIDSLTSDQCEGYIKLGWRSVPGATDYEAMMLRGEEMVTIGTTTNLNYVFSGLSKDSVYWVTVRPRINGKPGRRAVAVSRQPNNGTCAGSISDNDIKVDSILSPVKSGRLFTSTALTNTTPITIRIKNLDDAASTNDINVSYSINGGAPVNALLMGAGAMIAAQGFIDYTFATNANLSAVSTYSIAVTATKSGDPVTGNNTLTRIFRQLDNQPITNAMLPWLDDMETIAEQSHTYKQLGLTGGDRYDFVNSTVYGRIRSRVNTGMAYSGNRALTLDMYRNISGGNIDSLTGTYNLSAFNTSSDDIRIDFRYKNHGQSQHAANAVWIRGNESQPWIKVYDLFANQLTASAGYKLSESIELSDSLAAYGQGFSSSVQVRWGQWGQHMTADENSRAGYSFDNVRIYRATNDVQTLRIDAPGGNECGLTANEAVTATIRNTSNTPVLNVPVILRVNGTVVATETIASIPGSTTIQYTFNPGSANLSAIGDHRIDVWVDLATDSYAENDTASVMVKHLPLVNSFPYLQNFEAGQGSWYAADGVFNSWEYGTPNSPRIKGAASGSKAWKTNLIGYYNNQETGYLYSPCFNLSGMTNPTLSFSLALDLEDCGVAGLCDGAWVEYSTDGGNSWTKLGISGQGTNWYNKNYSGNHVWSQQDYTRWHVATSALPTTNNSSLRLRFVVDSDDGVNRDGLAIDDIHIYDNNYGIYEGATTTTAITQNINGGTSWVNFLSAGKLIASVQPSNQNMGSTAVQVYINTGTVRNHTEQYYHDRNITIKPSLISLADSAVVRFYFLDSESEALLAATGCTDCEKPGSAYELGVSKYSDTDDAKEDGDIINSADGVWSFIPPVNAVKVPFDKGYYVEFKVKEFSEFWLTKSGFNFNQPVPVDLLDFTATKASNNLDVALNWKTAAEWNVNRFEIEIARGNAQFQQNQFTLLAAVPSQGNSTVEQSYSYLDTENNKTGVRYYRLKIIGNDGRFTYSPVRPVYFTAEVQWQVFPNPFDGMINLLLQAPAGENVQIVMYDATGKRILMRNINATGFLQREELNLSSGVYSKGLYLLRLQAGGQQQSFKILKQ